MAELLWDYFNVTVIDRNDYFEHVQGVVKAMVDPEFVDKVVHPFDKMAQAYTKMTFKQASLETVNKNNSIDIKTKEGTVETVTFDYLIICTGFSYNQPLRDHNSINISDRRASLLKF